MTTKLKFGLVIAAVAVLMFGLLPVSSTAADEDYDGDYYVATNGSDTGYDGKSKEYPFQTIQHCAEKVKEGRKCIIRGGTYREEVVPKSGQSGLPITFEAYQDEIVIVSGTEKIKNSDWKPSGSSNIYYAEVPNNLWNDNQFFVVSAGAANEAPSVTSLWEARWPDISEYSLPALAGGMRIARLAGDGVFLQVEAWRRNRQCETDD